MYKIILKLILTFLFYCILPILIIFVSISILYRWILSSILIRFERGVCGIVHSNSQGMSVDDIYNLSTMTLSVVVGFEGNIDFEQLVIDFENRVLLSKDDNNKLLRPEGRQYIVQRGGYSFWKNDPNFNIRNHIQLGNWDYKLNGPLTPKSLNIINEKILCNGFTPKRSPWELLVYYNYKETPTSQLGTALTLRLHHSLGDGFSLLNLLYDLMGVPQPKEDPPESILNKILVIIRLLLFGPYGYISGTIDGKDDLIWKKDDSEMVRRYNMGISELIPLERIKEVKRICKVSFTSVILECYTGAIRKFMKEAGFEIPKKIHCFMPLPMIGHPGRQFRNHMSVCLTSLPVGNSDPMKRLKEIDRDLIRLRSSIFPLVTFKIMGLFGYLCRCISGSLIYNNLTTAIMSNFAGPNEYISYNGIHCLTGIHFSGGMFRGSCGMGFSGLSSLGNIRFVLGIDESIVPESKLPVTLLVEYFIDELDILKNYIEV